MDAMETALFGNRGGSHQILDASSSVRPSVLEDLRFLVDRPAGHVGAEVNWSPYWGCQAFGDWWALWRGEEDLSAPRRNMVTARVALIPAHRCSTMETLDDAFSVIGASPARGTDFERELAGLIASCIANDSGPAIISGISVAPSVLAILWSRMWPKVRPSLSLRTLFGVESMAAVSRSSIVVIPTELRPRWQGERVLGSADFADGLAARWFKGKASQLEERLVYANRDVLPSDLVVLSRVERIALCLRRLHEGNGTISDALLIVRTQEALPQGFVLGPDEQQLVVSALSTFDSASIEEVRSASLTTLDSLRDRRDVKAALACWVEGSLVAQSIDDAIWILEKQGGQTHARWWRQAIATGIGVACDRRSPTLAKAIWRWWQAEPATVSLTTCHMGTGSETEEWLSSSIPENLRDELLEMIVKVSREREWGTLLGGALGSERPLPKCIQTIRENLPNSDSALTALLVGREDAEIVDTAAKDPWPPLLARAVSCTSETPQLLVSAVGSMGFLPLLLGHLSYSGELPEEFKQSHFVLRVFDGVIEGNADYLTIAEHLDRHTGQFLLDHPDFERLSSCVPSSLIEGAAEEWWRRFLSEEDYNKPPDRVFSYISQSAGSRLNGGRISNVVRFLRIAPEVTEGRFIAWMVDTGFRWETGDHGLIAELIVERQWKAAAKALRWSWKRELVLVAWHARGILTGINRFLSAPEDSESPELIDRNKRKAIVLAFLAANPRSTTRLSLDEEAREIQEKVRDSENRGRVEIRTQWAVRPHDLQQILLENTPNVVHFAGHGGIDGIVLSAPEEGSERVVGAEDLADLFGLFKDEIRIVVLNACYSDTQARAIVKKVDFVIGMSNSIGDEAARVFAVAFYRALSFGRSVKKSFKLGINEMKLLGLSDDAAVPILMVRDGVDAKLCRLVR